MSQEEENAEENPEEEEEEDEDNDLEEESEEKLLKKKRKRRKKNFQEGEDEAEEELLGDEGEEGDESEDESYSSSEESTGSFYEEFGPVAFEFEDETYEFEPLVKPKKLKDIFSIKQAKEESDPLGKKEYLHVSEALRVPPVQRFYESLDNREIDLSYCGINPKGVGAICKALQINEKVQSLNLKDNKLTKDACYYLGILLRSNTTLTHLDLTGCRIGAEGVEMMTDGIAENESLKTLNLSKCYIGDEGMKVLAGGIKYNNGLHVLNLSYNNLANEGAEALGLAFRVNSNIYELDLNYNDMFDPGGLRAFFKGLMENEGVTKLILSWNALSGEETGRYLSAFLKKSNNLNYLDLSNNRLDKTAINEMRQGFQNARSLEVLKLGKNPIPFDAVEGLLGTVGGMENLKVLDLEDLWVKKSFIQTLNKIQETKDVKVNFAGVFSNYKIIGPDYKKLLLERARFEALKPKNKKARKDFGHLIWTFGDEPISKDDFMEKVKSFKAKISPSIFPELMKEFQITKTSLDVKSMREKYLSLFPDSQPAPVKKKKDEENEEDDENLEQEKISDKETIITEPETVLYSDVEEEEFEDEIFEKTSSLQEEIFSTMEELSESYEQTEDEL